MSFAQGVS